MKYRTTTAFGCDKPIYMNGPCLVVVLPSKNDILYNFCCVVNQSIVPTAIYTTLSDPQLHSLGGRTESQRNHRSTAVAVRGFFVWGGGKQPPPPRGTSKKHSSPPQCSLSDGWSTYPILGIGQQRGSGRGGERGISRHQAAAGIG